MLKSRFLYGISQMFFQHTMVYMYMKCLVAHVSGVCLIGRAQPPH